MDLFDLHCDTLYEIAKRGVIAKDNSLAVSTADFGLFEHQIRNYALYVEDGNHDPVFLYQTMMTAYHNLSIPLYTGKSFDGTVAILSVEGGLLLAECPEAISWYLRDGIHIASLTWNNDNELAGGAGGMGHLTKRGREMIRQFNHNGIALDVSHLNDKSFFEAVGIADTVLATHSCFRSCCNHLRNLTDEQAKIIAEKQGIIGLCFFPDFLGEEPHEGFIRQINHALTIGLEESLAIGSDFD